ncbi:phenylalanine--tRNA ligase subunit alpha [Patescibacteria group bacterium]|jgi:phenylalanyl-tRNA synthetase alpha chain|nr:phenylalanine--tRNA ligase subunit alpha [Patescibacteria group bacterium]
MAEKEIKKGHLHPISLMIREINTIFGELGFVFAEGPEMELIKYNFDMLNVPKDHPARDMQDTFYIEGKEDMVMRTHTSPVQVRYMQSHTPPIRMICPGKVFRNEATDATHEAQFYQLEGLMIDKDISVGHLKGTLEYFFKRFFGGEVEVRIRPSFFPFVEPGLEIDMRLTGDDAPPKLKGRWVEMMGAGMVHPNVIAAAGIDPAVYQGFAFGMGADRLAVMKYGVDDVRLFYGGDLRVVNQF